MIKTKINSDVLNQFVGESNSKNISQFQKHLIQEGVKQVLLGNNCSEVMFEYLKDLGIFKTSNFFDLFERKSKENLEFINSCLKTKIKTLDWDFDGMKNNINFFGTQRDWNQTLITRINEISSEIYKKTLRGGANIIICHPDEENIICDLEFLHAAYEECTGYIKLGTLGSRYTVLMSHAMKSGEILVTRIELNDENIKESEYDGIYGVVNVTRNKK